MNLQQSKVSLFDINKLALNPSRIFLSNFATLQKFASSKAYHNLIIKNRDHQTLFLSYKGLKLSRSYYCYGNLLCHKSDHNILGYDWADLGYHEIGNQYRVVIMTLQNLGLGKCRKLF